MNNVRPSERSSQERRTHLIQRIIEEFPLLVKKEHWTGNYAAYKHIEVYARKSGLLSLEVHLVFSPPYQLKLRYHHVWKSEGEEQDANLLKKVIAKLPELFVWQSQFEDYREAEEAKEAVKQQQERENRQRQQEEIDFPLGPLSVKRKATGKYKVEILESVELEQLRAMAAIFGK